MKYLGGKFRIRRHIVPLMLRYAEEAGITTWVEPFVGGGSVIEIVPSSFRRLGADINPHTIAALVAIRDHPASLPDRLTEASYKELKGRPPEPISSWLRFIASFLSSIPSVKLTTKGCNEAQPATDRFRRPSL